jgi:hypothetical protein
LGEKVLARWRKGDSSSEFTIGEAREGRTRERGEERF